MHEIETEDDLRTHLDAGLDLRNTALQGLDLTGFAAELGRTPVDGALFLGCVLTGAESCDLQRRGALIFPRFEGLPYRPFRGHLYTPEELFDGFDPERPCSYCETLDARVYRHWRDTGRAEPRTLRESLARRLHDHAVTDAIHDLMDDLAARSGRRPRVVAVMGGHSMPRGAGSYRDVAWLARELARDGYLLASGGGPGAMEATHVGAWFADRADDDLDAAIGRLAAAPSYQDERWLAEAFLVRAAFPPPGSAHRSLGIPTWLYGHEPPNPFATDIGKYFANSVREDGLVTVASHGIVFSPGSAGTVQEAFQDAAQNHYATTGAVSPMVFLGVDHWTREQPVFPVLQRLARGRPYERALLCTDDPAAAVRFLRDHPPVPDASGGWSFCGAFCGEGGRSAEE